MTKIIFLVLFLLSSSSFALAPNTGTLFTYEGILTDSSGTPITSTQLVTFQIFYSGSCIVYEETQSISPGTSGEFSVSIGSGSRQDTTSTNTADRIFASSGSVDCKGAAAQTVSGFEARTLHIIVGGTDLFPDVTLNTVPMAINAQRLNDKSSGDFVQTSTNITQSNVESAFSRYTALDHALNTFGLASSAGQVLINGGSSFVPGNIVAGSGISITPSGSDLTISAAASSLSGDVSGTQVATKVVALQNKAVSASAPSNNDVLTWNGSAWAPAALPAGNAGTVTSVTGSGPISVATGTLTPVVSISQAGPSSNGYLSSADWNTFNVKQSHASTLSGYGITDAVENAGNTVSIQSGVYGAKPAPSLDGKIYIATDTQEIYRDNGSAWVKVASVAGSGGSVTSVNSANTDISVASGTTTPVLTLNSGTSANQILKLDGSSKIPAVNGSQITNLNPTSLSTVVPVTKGGTGQSTFTDGQLLIGNSTGNTLTKATLTAGTGVSVTNGNGLITIATTGLQSSTLANGKILVGNSSNIATAVSASQDISMTDTGAVTVTGVKGKSVSAAPTATGQVLRYDGSSWTPNFVGMLDLRSKVTGTQALASSCTAAQTLTYSSVLDNLTCSNIAIDGSQVTYTSQTANTFLAAPNGSAGAPTFRAILSSDLPSSILSGLWTGSGGNVYRTSGNVGIGTTSPQAALDVRAVSVPPTYITGSISAGTSSIPISVNSTSSWPSAGLLTVDNEIMAFTVSNSSQFQITGRGQLGSAPTDHPTWSSVSLVNFVAPGANGGAALLTKNDGVTSINRFIASAGEFQNSAPLINVSLSALSNTSIPPASPIYVGATDRWPSSGIMSVDGEMISFVQATNPGYIQVTGRGLYGTPPVSHSNSSTVTFVSLVAASKSPANQYSPPSFVSNSDGTTNVIGTLETASGPTGFTLPNSLGTGNINYSVPSTTNWPSGGLMVIDGEILSYYVLTFNSIQITGRGLYGTSAASHSSGAPVGFINTLSSALPTSGSSVSYTRSDGGAFFSGKVGIGATTPRAALDVRGAIVANPAVANSGSPIDFSTGNIQYTSASCGNFTLNNLKDGGTYTFVVKGSTSNTCYFTAYSDVGSSSLNVRTPPDWGNTQSSKHTVFTLLVAGGDVYVSWTPGY